MDFPVDVRARWWYTHVDHTRQYVGGIFNRQPFKAIKALEGLWHGVRQWQDLTGVLGGVLMGEHTILIKKFIEHARDFRTNEADYLVSYLMEDADDQTKIYKQKFDSFPADQWEKLFKDHIAETGAYVTALAKGDMSGYEDHWRKVLENTKEIAEFARSSFPVPEGLMGDEEEMDGAEEEELEGVERTGTDMDVEEATEVGQADDSGDSNLF